MKPLLTILLALFITIASAQETILFKDDFNDANQWEKYDNDNASATISNGTYVIKHKTDSYSYFYWKPIYMEPNKNFYIEAKMKLVEGPEDEGYGICWNTNGWDDSYVFSVSSTGFFCIWGYKGEKYYQLKGWTENAAIKPKGQFNVLAVERQGGVLNFYVNSVKVHTTNYLPSFGRNQGFALVKKMTVAIDYFIVKHPPIKINLASTTFSKYKKENMKSAINSGKSEIAPIISPDGKTLYISREEPGQDGVFYKMYDIFYSTLKADSTWTPLQSIGKPINNEGVNCVITVSADGNTLLLEGRYNANGTHAGENGISMSTRTENGWTVPQEIKIKNYYNYNVYETYSFTNDRKVLIFSLERKDTKGDLDLYVSFLQNDGTYSEPKNMGITLNTYAPEGTPFIAADSKTLYFSSEGHAGYGSADIFVTRRLDDTWTNWSEPQNMGPSLNTSGWDSYFAISAKGDFAYLVSTQGGNGDEDIYRLKLEDPVKPDPVVLIYGNVYNEKTKKPMKAKISYENLKNKKEVGTAISEPKWGSYRIILPYGFEYGYRAMAKDFYSVSENIDLKKTDKYIEIKRDLYLVPIEVGETVILKNVFFVRGKAELEETSLPELERLLQFLKDNPAVEIEISGHTENVGPADKLLKLSEDRVGVVKKYLVDKGINEKRIIGKGYGGSKTIASDATDEGRKQNRRVEFKILKK